MSTALKIIRLYTEKLDMLVPITSQRIQDDDDSQEYGSNVFSEVEFARIEYIGVSLVDLSPPRLLQLLTYIGI